jgi:hypothetical protein
VTSIMVAATARVDGEGRVWFRADELVPILRETGQTDAALIVEEMAGRVYSSAALGQPAPPLSVTVTEVAPRPARRRSWSWWRPSV